MPRPAVRSRQVTRGPTARTARLPPPPSPRHFAPGRPFCASLPDEDIPCHGRFSHLTDPSATRICGTTKLLADGFPAEITPDQKELHLLFRPSSIDLPSHSAAPDRTTRWKTRGGRDPAARRGSVTVRRDVPQSIPFHFHSAPFRAPPDPLRGRRHPADRPDGLQPHPPSPSECVREGLREPLEGRLCCRNSADGGMAWGGRSYGWWHSAQPR